MIRNNRTDPKRDDERGYLMLRRLTGAVALASLFSVVAVPVAESDPARSAPMQFLLRQESGACADKCRAWVSATGMIKADTVRDFEALAAKHDLRGMMLVLNSEGGSVHGALSLGRAVRKLGMTTSVGRTVEAAAKSGSEATLLPRADCESMCAFVLLGGTKRMVPAEARVRVHQIWLGDRRDDATAATYSAEDLVLVQRDIGKLAQYTIEMGGSVELLEVALRIPPWEPMKSLTRDEMRRMRLDIDNVEAAETPAAPPAVINSAPATTGSVRRMSTGAERGGWAMAERGGQVVLTRRHPLTVEGEDIGSFDVSISCGEKPNEYLLSYNERRRGRGDRAAPALKEVQVRLGYKTVALALKKSEQTSSSERASSAGGVFTAATMTGFAANASRSLTIGTMVADSTTTNIRIGNTGAAQHFPQLATSCAQGRTEHAGLLPKQ
jgi:hypothetical protein